MSSTGLIRYWIWVCTDAYTLDEDIMERTPPPIAKDDFEYGKDRPSPRADAAAATELHVVWLQKFLMRTKPIAPGNCNTTRRRR